MHTQINLRRDRFLSTAADAIASISRNAEKDIQMNDGESFSTSIYEDQTHLAERELSAFTKTVAELFGPEQVRASAEYWLDEAELMDTPPRSTARDWGAVTIAASARLASRIDAAQYRQKSDETIGLSQVALGTTCPKKHPQILPKLSST